MATLQEQIAQAKAAGYSDDDIAKHLGGRADLAPKIKQATDAGYKPDQIVAHLAGAAPAKPKEESSGIGNLVKGAMVGVADIGDTVIDAGVDLVGGIAPKLAQWNRTRNADMEYIKDKHKDSAAFDVGRIGANVAMTLPVGGALGAGVRAAAPVLTRAGASANTIQGLANAMTTGGFKAGAVPGARNMLMRIAGGAATGGASAGLIDPSDAGTGAAIGAALPPVLSAAGKVGGWAGRSIYSLAQPFTTAGQERIAGKIINKFAQGGPTAVNVTEIVPGSAPTLAEATGNAGIARLQSAARDVNPNRFVERELANAGKVSAAFDDVAGDSGKLDFFKAARAAAADDLYGQALKADTGANVTPFIKGQITQLLKRPSIHEARKTAQKWAIERGEKPSFDGNMTGLHDIKMALDDDISVAIRAGKGGQAKALEATKAKLLDVMEKLSPAYKEARVTYAEMSKPVNQMEVLQGLKLTDAKGNITLAKVQSALDGLEKKIAGDGIDAAKSLTSTQIGTLQAIRDDLLRKSNSDLGRSAGSNTFQNLATDNVLSTVMPGKLGEIVGNKAGGVFGQIGRLMYSGPNEAIRNRMVDLMLDPRAAEGAMRAAQQPILTGPAAASIRDLANSASPVLYRSAPVLSSSQ